MGVGPPFMQSTLHQPPPFQTASTNAKLSELTTYKTSHRIVAAYDGTDGGETLAMAKEAWGSKDIPLGSKVKCHYRLSFNDESENGNIYELGPDDKYPKADFLYRFRLMDGSTVDGRKLIKDRNVSIRELCYRIAEGALHYYGTYPPDQDPAQFRLRRFVLESATITPEHSRNLYALIRVCPTLVPASASCIERQWWPKFSLKCRPKPKAVRVYSLRATEPLRPKGLDSYFVEGLERAARIRLTLLLVDYVSILDKFDA